MKNGRSRDKGNSERNTQNENKYKRKSTPQKTKKMTNMNPTKKLGVNPGTRKGYIHIFFPKAFV